MTPRRLLVGLALCTLVLGCTGFVLHGAFERVLTWTLDWKPLELSAAQPGSRAVAVAAPVDGTERLKRAQLALQAPSLTVAVARDGALLWTESLGFADVEARTPANENTVYRLGSTSKAVTSLLAGRLFEQGKLEWDAPVSKYLPGYPHAGVTPRRLASHQAGLRHYEMCLCFPVWEYYSRASYASVKESLEVFIEDPLIFEPGTQFKYSTYGYVLLSAVLESAGGADFDSLLRREVFDVAQVKGVGLERNGGLQPDARGYEVEGERYKPADTVDNSGKWAGGGMVGTPRELALLGSAFLSDGLVKPATRELLFTPGVLPDGTTNPYGYGLGWRRFKWNHNGRELVVHHHGGAAAGSTFFWMVIPEEQLSVAIAMNRSMEQAWPLAEQTLELIAPIAFR
ncbi:serine hydrolase domain-containing protein [Corallococcus terminator]